ncbi:organic solute transporter subunit alpha [Chrysoperla carnea]|uniref:organic solute transporter subunit alpha n=1 Tax=Chrysoperla carnea TaxID=189513 RepID=UPI001D09540F|nr:organic solute transporter subunit alpha [Chrysoperla carnea]
MADNNANNGSDITMEYINVFGSTRQFNYNTSILCPLNHVPSMSVYFSAINIYGVGLFTIGGFIVVTILLFYVDIIKFIMQESKTPRVKTHTTFVISVYPVISIVTYCAMIVPRAQLLAEAVTQGVFMAAMYQLFCLFVAYCGGEAELIQKVKPDTILMTKVGPCCCWPCCILPKLPIDKTTVCFLRMLVLQLPVVQGMVYMILLIMWAEEESLYQINYMYIQPIIIISILFGIWGMIMTITMLKTILKTYSIQLKFMVLQIVLILAKLQGFATRIITWSDILPCKPPITPPVYGNLIYNCVMLIEMLILIIIARIIYKRTLSNNYKIESNNNNNNNNTINTITTIDGSNGSTAFQQNIVGEQQLQQQTIGGQFEKQKY